MVEDNEINRRKEYRKLRAGGKSDFEAREAVWPSTTLGFVKRKKDDEAKVQAENDAAAERASSKSK
jgi:hypothetical protein